MVRYISTSTHYFCANLRPTPFIAVFVPRQRRGERLVQLVVPILILDDDLVIGVLRHDVYRCRRGSRVGRVGAWCWTTSETLAEERASHAMTRVVRRWRCLPQSHDALSVCERTRLFVKVKGRALTAAVTFSVTLEARPWLDCVSVTVTGSSKDPEAIERDSHPLIDSATRR